MRSLSTLPRAAATMALAWLLAATLITADSRAARAEVRFQAPAQTTECASGGRDSTNAVTRDPSEEG